MSASLTGRPRSSLASRSMTRVAVNGSPVSPMFGGSMAGSGRPAGAGRSGPRPMVTVGASVTGDRSPSEPLGVAESSAAGGTGPSGGRRLTDEVHDAQRERDVE